MESKKAVSFFIKLENEPRVWKSGCAEKPLTDEEWVQKYIDGTLNPRAGKMVFDEESVGDFGPTVSADVIHRRFEARLKHIVEGETSDSTLLRSRDKT